MLHSYHETPLDGFFPYKSTVLPRIHEIVTRIRTIKKLSLFNLLIRQMFHICDSFDTFRHIQAKVKPTNKA